ncbi:MAG TPA: iron donor protein CyaY [Rickettsiales bacterium]|nr:iron donor protein CyaY [Rickettsiales bacterium]
MTINFYTKSENFLTYLADKIEKIDKNSLFDVEYSDGILNITIDKTNQQYVINRHNANQKIWYSSPFSGADYFSFDEKSQNWLDDSGFELETKLFKELELI